MKHPFERAKLGTAPYRFLGIIEKVYVAYPGAPAQPAGTCSYCGMGIKYCALVRGADGYDFIVGTDCVAKVFNDYGDNDGIAKGAAREMKVIRNKRAAELREVKRKRTAEQRAAERDARRVEWEAKRAEARAGIEAHRIASNRDAEAQHAEHLAKFTEGKRIEFTVVDVKLLASWDSQFGPGYLVLYIGEGGERFIYKGGSPELIRFDRIRGAYAQPLDGAKVKFKGTVKAIELRRTQRQPFGAAEPAEYLYAGVAVQRLKQGDWIDPPATEAVAA